MNLISKTGDPNIPKRMTATRYPCVVLEWLDGSTNKNATDAAKAKKIAKYRFPERVRGKK